MSTLTATKQIVQVHEEALPVSTKNKVCALVVARVTIRLAVTLLCCLSPAHSTQQVAGFAHSLSR